MVEPYETDDDNRRNDNEETNDDQSDDHNKKENQNKIRLYRIAKQIHEKEDMFVDQYHTPYAFVKINDHMEVLDVYSLRFQHWVYRKLIWYDNGGRAILPEPADVTRILDYLKAHAEFDVVQKVLHLRVAAGDDTDIYYDLTSQLWEAIKVTPQGWLVEKTPTMMFRRYKNQTAQVYPSREYPDDIFDRFINLINVKNEDSKLLLKCYIVALLIPDIPKAILMLHGEPNSAKTTLLELIKMLIDPCSTRTLTFRQENDELAQLFSHNYLPYFDNLSYISDWMSDAFCRAATGDSFSKRKLYTDNDDIFYTFMRCIGFSGVNLAATKSDLLDRGLIIELERISSDSQRQIKKIWKDFDEMKPQLLGYIFDILAKVLNMRQASHIDVKGLPRLADWAEACELISRCMGYEDNQFIEAFRRNVKLQNEAAIEDSAIAQMIIRFMEERSRWEGTPTELLVMFEEIAPSLSINTKNHKIFPSKPNVLTRRLKYIISNLKEFDIIVRPGDNSTTKNRTLCIEKKKVVVQSSIPPIHRYDTQNDAQVSSDISIDRVDGIDTSIDTPQIPIPENLQIHAQNGSGIDGIDSIDILQDNNIQIEPIQSIEEFFYDGPDLPYKPLPPHTLDQSPCRPIIYKKEQFYSCKLHPNEANSIYLDAIEQHCKYKDSEVHKSEILKLLPKEESNVKPEDFDNRLER
jgi:hypothetical protein